MKWFTADWHFHHDGILEMCNRQFSTIHLHDVHLQAMVNRYVRPADTLYVLGDVAWHDPGVTLKKLACSNVHLIWGNHDRENFARWFKSAQDTHIVKLDTHRIFLSHYAHAFWPGSHKGWLHLYGHNHSQREEYLDKLWPERRSMDCGVDNAKRLLGEYRPFSEDEVLEILGPRKGHDDVQFYIDLQEQQRNDPVV